MMIVADEKFCHFRSCNTKGITIVLASGMNGSSIRIDLRRPRKGKCSNAEIRYQFYGRIEKKVQFSAIWIIPPNSLVFMCHLFEVNNAILEIYSTISQERAPVLGGMEDNCG